MKPIGPEYRRPGAARPQLLAAALFAALCTCSCARAGSCRTVLQGNRAMKSGHYEDAIVSYLSVKNEAQDPILSYNLANAYARLGETNAAVALYQEVRKTASRDLCEASYYNEGVLLYEKGRYGDAAAAFKAALSISPRDEEARRNYERSLRDSIRMAGASPREFLPAQKTDKGEGDEDLRFLRRIETGRLKSVQTTEEEGYTDDY